MIRILFVDDEPMVLDGLRDSLRRRRKEWDMRFVGSGEAALSLMEREAMDIVVSDMRMPGMDGAAFLQAVRLLHPQCARIILSGQADRSAILRALPVAQQFLSKPCDPALLQATLGRLAALQAITAGSLARDLVGRIDRLPSAPATYWRITEAAMREDTDREALARIIEEDSALSAKLLQLVNSAVLGARRKVATVREGLDMVGIELIRGLALSAEAFSLGADVGPAERAELDQLQRHTLLVAGLARTLLPTGALASEVFTACMIHDLGKIVLLYGAPERYAAARHLITTRAAMEDEAETRLIGISHSKVGAYLLGLWGLPVALVEAAAFHHTPSEAHDGAEGLAVLHFCEAMIEAVDRGHPDELELDLPFLNRLGLGPRLGAWRAQALSFLSQDERGPVHLTGAA